MHASAQINCVKGQATDSDRIDPIMDLVGQLPNHFSVLIREKQTSFKTDAKSCGTYVSVFHIEGASAAQVERKSALTCGRPECGQPISRSPYGGMRPNRVSSFIAK